MREFFRNLARGLESGRPAVLVSLLSAGGSTPRGMGAMMAVYPGGRSQGTIGGGSVEYEAQKLAAALLETGECAIREYRFLPGGPDSLGMVCGGEVTVHFQFLPGGDAGLIGALRSLVSASPAGGLWLVRRLEGASAAETRACTPSDRGDPALAPLLGDVPVRTEDGWFSVPVERAGRVILFGGGHVSQRLAEVLAMAEFRHVVYDDRPEFASQARFPAAEERLCAPFADIQSRLHLTAEDYVVVMTRGHQADYEVLAQTLRSGAKYLGCIGSRRKLELCRERLLEHGFTPEEYARLHAPIGLAIGAETAEEIAVSVAAELIAVRSGASV